MIRLRFLAGIVAGVVLIGCESTPDMSPSPGMGDPYPAPFNDPQITLLAPELRNWVRFDPALIVDDGRAPMQVEVPARNTTDRLYLIDYRFVFFDDRGFELEPVMGWKFQELRPKQMVRLKGAALTTAADRYRLEVKWSR